jgi:hypothetical protein
LKERGFVEDLLESEMIILKLNLKEYVTKFGSGFIGHKVGKNAGLF